MSSRTNNTATAAAKRAQRGPASSRIELGPRSYLEWLHVDSRNMRRAIAYLRLSSQTSTNRDNLETQLDYCEAQAATLDCVIVARIVEYGEKAFDREHIEDRPGMLQLLKLVSTNECEVVLGFQQERMFRDDLELAQFKRYCRRANVTYASKQGVVEPNDPSADAMSTIVGAISKLDSAVKQVRSYAKHEQLAEKGAPSLGGIRPFGYEDDRLTPNAPEALAISTGLDAFLNSVSLREIARRWNDDDKLLTPSAIKPDGTPRGGNRWTTTTVRQVLRSHRIAGQRLHRRTGKVYEAQWRSIVDRGKWERAQQLLDDPARRTNERKRSYMLTGGLLHCGVCGTTLISRPRRSQRCYICPKDRGGCGGVSVHAEHVERRANEIVRTFLADGKMPGVARFSIVTESNELADVRASLVRIQTGWADGRLDDAAFEFQQRRLLERERTLAAAVVRAQVPEWLKQRGETAKRWKSLDEQTRRSVIAYCVEFFVIERRDGRNGPHFDESRVVPEWSARTK